MIVLPETAAAGSNVGRAAVEPALTTSEPATISTPSRTYARVVPMTVADGSITLIEMPPAPNPSAVA